MALVQTPGAVDRDPVAVRGFQRELGGADGALLEGGVQDIGEQTGVLEQLTAADCLLLALLGEVDVHPTGEQVLRVPFALAVAEEDQLVRCVGHEPERNRSPTAFAPPVTGRTAQGGGRGRLTARVNRVAVRNPCFVMFGLQPGHLPDASAPYVPGGNPYVCRRSQTGRTRDRLRSPQRVLVAVDQHPGQPARGVRRHVHGALPDHGPRLLRLVRGSGRRAARAGRGHLLARCRGDDRPARAAGPPC